MSAELHVGPQGFVVAAQQQEQRPMPPQMGRVERVYNRVAEAFQSLREFSFQKLIINHIFMPACMRPKSRLLEKENDFFQMYEKNIKIHEMSSEQRREYRKNKLKMKIKIPSENGRQLDGMRVMHPTQENQPPSEQRWFVHMMCNSASYKDCLVEGYEMANATNCNLLMADYGGVGESEGVKNRPMTSDDLITDGLAMIQSLVDQGINPKHIMIYGICQGGAVAAQVAAKCPGVHTCIDRSFSEYSAVIRSGVSNKVSVYLGERLGDLAARIIAFVVPYLISWDLNNKAASNQIRMNGGRQIIIQHEMDEVISGKYSLGHFWKQQLAYWTYVDKPNRDQNVPDLIVIPKEDKLDYALTQGDLGKWDPTNRCYEKIGAHSEDLNMFQLLQKDGTSKSAFNVVADKIENILRG